MKQDDQQPEPKPSGSRMPPRPPIRTTVDLDFGGDEPDKPKRPGNHTVRINLPPKPTTAPTIHMCGSEPA